MDDWHGVIAVVIYMLQFRKNPTDDVEMLYRAIHRAGVIVFSPSEIHEAVVQALASDEDLSQLLPQPHSDAILRDVFKALKAKFESGETPSNA